MHTYIHRFSTCKNEYKVQGYTQMLGNSTTFLIVFPDRQSSQDPIPNESLNDHSDSADNILEVAEDGEPCEPHLPSMYHPATRRTHRILKRKKEAAAMGESDSDGDGESDSFSELDDKEIDKYIATRKEVSKPKLPQINSHGLSFTSRYIGLSIATA